MKILFVTANRVGDAVLTTGLLRWMIEHYPQAQFTIACGPYGADLFRAVPRLERLILMRKKKYNGHWLDLWRMCINTHWDLIVDMRNSLATYLLRSKHRASYARASGMHKVIENARVLNLSPPPSPTIWITAQAQAQADQLIPAGIQLLAIGPAANWPLKQWPVASFQALVSALTSSGGALVDAHVMVACDKEEYETIAPLVSTLPEKRLIKMVGHDLQLVAACLKRARLYVGNDSGLMHMASALGVPTLGLFGPGFPLIYGPWGEKGAYVTTPESREELLARAPKIVTPQSTLMDGLSVEAVLSAAITLLQRTS